MTAEDHFKVANEFAGAGKREEALTHYRLCLRLQPDHAEACANLGVGLAEQGKLDEALAVLREALRLKPDLAKGHHNLGVALAQTGRNEDAVTALAQALRLKPDYPEACYNLGNVLVTQGKRAEAVEVFKNALRLKPDYAEVYNNLGLALTDLGRVHEAAVILEQGTRLRPGSAEAFNNFGLTLAELGRFAEAEAAYRQALRLNPHFADAHSNLASTLKEQGRLVEAITSYDIALYYQPKTASYHWNRSLALLHMGNFEEGWREYEWRWQRPQSPPRQFAQPLWDGSDLTGRTILLWMEQGLGDMIQFLRYAPLLKSPLVPPGRGAGGEGTSCTVLVECPPFLIPLFCTCPGIDHVIAEGTPLPPFDVHAPLMSLPHLCRTTALPTIPNKVPYLFPDPALVEQWLEKLASRASLAEAQSEQKEGPSPRSLRALREMSSHQPFRIGIAWQGNIHHKWDRHRSIPLVEFAPLAAMPDVQLVSLQKGPGAEQVRDVAFPIADLGEDFDTAAGAFMDTAAVCKNLDLVITADTALAHLAGALGVPVWVGLSVIADWRWLAGREDSPWYPTMRLFRQRALGDWAGVIDQMRAELLRMISPGGAAVHSQGRESLETEPARSISALEGRQ